MGSIPTEKKQLGKVPLKRKAAEDRQLDELLSGPSIVTAAPSESDVPGPVAKKKDASTCDLSPLRALSERYGLPGIDLEQIVVPLENLAIIPRQIAVQHLILPILIKTEHLFLAMADPGDRRVIDEIEFVTGRKVFSYVALKETITSVIEEAYSMRERGASNYIGPNAPEDYLVSLGLAAEGSPNPAESGLLQPVFRSSVGVVTEAKSPEDMNIDELQTDSRSVSSAASSGLRGVASGRSTSDDVLARRSRTVLVVDDEQDIRRLLKRVLAEQGFQVLEADNGSHALEVIRTEQLDLILLDAMLPEVHGFDLCRRLKGSQRYGDIPIVMVSAIYRGWRVAEDLRTSFGVDAFVEKPFKISHILAAVEKAMQGGTALQAASETAEDVAKLLQKGIDAYKSGDAKTAMASLREGLHIDPLSFELHYHLGLLLGREEQLFEAIHELETASDLQPQNFSSVRNLAILYQRAGFKHKAVEMWERALANAPDEETKRGIKDHLRNLF